LPRWRRRWLRRTSAGSRCGCSFSHLSCLLCVFLGACQGYMAWKGEELEEWRCAPQAAAERPVDMATDVAEERGRSGRLGADGASGLGTSEPPSQAGAAEKMEVDTRADARCLTLGRVLWSLALCVSRVCMTLATLCGST